MPPRKLTSWRAHLDDTSPERVTRALASGSKPCQDKHLEQKLSLLPIVVSGSAVAAAGAAAWGAVSPWSQLYGPTVRRTSSPRKVALTFDDGPNPAVTPRLLELFDRYSVRATFFAVGKFARACPDLVREISERGHALGNHTDTHPNLFFELRAGIRDQIARCQDAIASAAGGEPPRWMRPPYGYRNPLLDAEVRRARMQIVLWSKICWDWKPQRPQGLIERLSSVARTDRQHGDVVVLHDGDHRALGSDRGHVVAALGHWLPRWRDADMEFVTMDSATAPTSDSAQGARS
jgi:peptidoglycan-N-acetylglucosamine deacetylase